MSKDIHFDKPLTLKQFREVTKDVKDVDENGYDRLIIGDGDMLRIISKEKWEEKLKEKGIDIQYNLKHLECNDIL